MRKKVFHVILFLLFALPALACSVIGGDEPTPTPTAQPAATAQVAATAAPTEAPATPTVEPSPTTDLTAGFVSYTSEENGITIQYPPDWVVQDFFVLLVASDQSIVDAPNAIQDGAGVVFAAGPAEDFQSTDPISLANEAVEQFSLSEDATIVEGPTLTTIQGQPGAIAKIEATPAETGVTLIGYAVVVMSGDRVGVGLGITPKDSEAEYISTIQAILNTMEVGEPAETGETEISNDPPNADTALPVSIGDEIDSSFDENGRTDFIFSGQEGATVTFTAAPLNDDIDLVIEIFDTDLNSLFREDDGFSGEPEVIGFTPPADGEYFIRVSDFFGTPGDFTFSVTEGGETVSVNPEGGILIPNIPVDASLAGDPVQFIFSAVAGEDSTLLLLPDEDLDPTLTILDTEGNILVDEVDDGFSGEPEAITFTPDSDGDYVLQVDAFGSLEGGFSLLLIDKDGAVTADGTVSDNGSQNFRVCVPADAFLIVVVNPSEDFDPVVNLNGAGGGQLIDETDGGASGDSEVVFLTEPIDPDSPFPVIVSIRGFGGQSGDFSVIITSTSPEAVVLDGC